MSIRSSLAATSRVTPGCAARKRVAIGGRTFIATITGTLSLSVPRGLERKPLTTSSPLSISPSAGASRSSRRWPASVGVTLRVVRLRRRTPSAASSRRTASLKAEADPPRAAAAPRKPRARATATKASRSARLGLAIRASLRPEASARQPRPVCGFVSFPRTRESRSARALRLDARVRGHDRVRRKRLVAGDGEST